MSDDDLICVCMAVTRGEIKNAVRQGNQSLDGLKATLFCCTGCGTCEGRVTKVMEEEMQTAAAASAESAERKAG